MKKVNLGKVILIKLVIILLSYSTSSCNSQSRAAKKLAEDSKLARDTATGKNIEGSLSFQQVTLDQADEQGRPLWKVKAKQAVYSNNNKIAKVQNPFGDLFQDGKLLYQISALEGEVHEDGKKIFLKGQIVATDTQNGVVLRGNELEWSPDKDELIVRDRLTGSHKELEASAREGRSYSRQKRIELIGQVVATTKDPKEPPLQMKTEHLIWQVGEKKMFSDRPVQIDRIVDNKTIDRATGERGDVDLNTKIATLKQNAQLAIADPALDIASDLLVWNYNAKTVVSDRPVRVFHRIEQVTLISDRGRVDLEQKIAYLTGKVYGVGKKPPSQMRTDRMTWYLATESFEAEGNVFYKQVDPPLNLTGPKAIGQLKNQSIVVTGGNGGRVETQIIP